MAVLGKCTLRRQGLPPGRKGGVAGLGWIGDLMRFVQARSGGLRSWHLTLCRFLVSSGRLPCGGRIAVEGRAGLDKSGP